MTITVGQTLP